MSCTRIDGLSKVAGQGRQVKHDWRAPHPPPEKPRNKLQVEGSNSKVEMCKATNGKEIRRYVT